MTRFNAKTSRGDTLRELTKALKSGGYTFKSSGADVNNERHSLCHRVQTVQSSANSTLLQVTVSTMDRRKNMLTFKAFLYDMADNILVDFRLSRVSGPINFPTKAVIDTLIYYCCSFFRETGLNSSDISSRSERSSSTSSVRSLLTCGRLCRVKLPQTDNSRRLPIHKLLHL